VNHKKTQRKPVSVRLTARERAIIRAKAEAEGLGQGEFLRRLIVAKIGNEPEESAADRAADAAMVAAQMTAQVWAHLHVMLRSSPTETTQIEATFAKIQNQYLPSEDAEREE